MFASIAGFRGLSFITFWVSIIFPATIVWSGGVVTVQGVRWWSDKEYLRVVVDLDGEVMYKAGFLREDPETRCPPRLYVDFRPARLVEGIPRITSLEGPLCKRIRVAQFDPQTVRVVLEVGEVKDHQVFFLGSPYRLVIDLYSDKIAFPSKEVPTRRVTLVIDPGHGGKDPGAIGPTGLMEKDVVLKVGKLLREKAKSLLGWNVIMTREEDRYLPLEERTAIANAKGGDLFLSLHCNASRDRSRRGIETYFLSFTTDREVLRLAARENGVPPSQIDALQVILYDLMMRAKVEDSEKLANYVQERLIFRLTRDYNSVLNLGVKRAPFIVLVGAKMPSILTEISFISNPYEEGLLKDPRYLDAVADGILQGLETYAKDHLPLPALTGNFRQ